MDLEQVLRKAGESIRESIRLRLPINEAVVKQSILFPVLDELGWDVTNAQEVVPEFKVVKGKVDYALCKTAESPLVFIEAKKLDEVKSKAEKQLFGMVGSEAEKQLFKYNSKENVPLLVLTDGSIWNLYLRRTDDDSTRRNFIMRKFLHMELSREEKIPEYARFLETYLQKDRVLSGDARREAEKRDEALDGIRRTWESLLETPDDMLCNLLVKQVKKGGAKPNPADVKEFLRTAAIPLRLGLCCNWPQADVKEFLRTAAINSGSRVLSLAENKLARKKKAAKTTRKKTTRKKTARKKTAKKVARPMSSPARSDSAQKRKSRQSKILGFILDGQEKNCGAGIQTLAEVLREFQRRDAGFIERFAPKTEGTKNRLVAQNRDDLYRDSSETDYSVKLENGWWMGTHRRTPEILKYIKTACEVVGVQFGSQLTLIER